MYDEGGQPQYEIATGKTAELAAQAAERAEALKASAPNKFYGSATAPSPSLKKPSPAPQPKKSALSAKQSPTAAYVFAVLFAILYGVGRVLEDWLIKVRFRRNLTG